jgi:RNA polymerase sigma-70 factor (ECF subfamily)
VSDSTAEEQAPDFDAMARLSKGEDKALNELMGRWTPRLGGFLVRLIGNEADAAELVQETFVAVYRARFSYRPKTKFSTWLFGIANNMVRQRLRWRRRHPEMALCAESESEDETERHPTTEKNPASDLEASEKQDAIRSAVLALPTDLREALILAEYEELPHAECAKILGCTPKAVETRIYRARAQLRERLKTWL